MSDYRGNRQYDHHSSRRRRDGGENRDRYDSSSSYSHHSSYHNNNNDSSRGHYRREREYNQQEYQPPRKQARIEANFYDMKHNDLNTHIFVDKQPLIEFIQHKYQNDVVCSPVIELNRSHMMRSLRDKLVQLLREKIDIDEPKECFNRWLMERKMLEKVHGSSLQHFDPLLPSICVDEEGRYISPTRSESLAREISEDLPLKVNMFPKNTFEAKRSIMQYLNACQRKAKDVSSFTDGDLKKITDEFNETMEWLNQIQGPQEEKVIVTRLEELKKTIGAMFKAHLAGTVEEICTTLAVFGYELVQTLQKQMKENTERVRVYVNHITHKGLVDVECSRFRTTINETHYRKLKEYFTLRHSILHNREDENNKLPKAASTIDMDRFHDALACLLIRYSAFFGGGDGKRYEGAGLQAALPEKVFQLLRDELSVRMECFASPLNCFFANFCSAFPDIDHLFGSVTSFFEFKPTTGSFEANPPFTEELMSQMVAHMEKLLTDSSEPLSFIIFVPNWTDATCLIQMQESRYLTKDIVLQANKHGYVNGFQHNSQQHRRNYVAVHETHIFLLQNESGKNKWVLTDELTQKIVEAFSSNAQV